jgi:hypothetical protein
MNLSMAAPPPLVGLPGNNIIDDLSFAGQVGQRYPFFSTKTHSKPSDVTLARDLNPSQAKNRNVYEFAG